jgi:spermidine dehydrogenase
VIHIAAIIAYMVDSSLGMDRPISRRDFLDGVALSTATTLVPRPDADRRADDVAVDAAEELGHGRPPEWQGLQGDTADAMAVPHALRDRRFWERAGTPTATGEEYDLVVVGAGVSGIAAAYRWWREDPEARILVLDNHDDIGGRSRRNEFRTAGHPLVGYGGPPSLPSSPTPETAELLAELGIELGAGLDAGLDTAAGGAADAAPVSGWAGREPYRALGMGPAVFCDRESFGTDRLVVFRPGWVDELPLADAAKGELAALFRDPPDWWPQAGTAEKRARLARISYSGFLREICRAHPEVVRFCHTMPVHDRCRTSDMISALDAYALADEHTFPGLAGLGIPRPAARSLVQLFPDGNHGLIRALVGRMIPGAGEGPDDGAVPDRLDYDRLDLPANRVRVRLSSPVVLVRNDGPAETATSATVGYFDGEHVRTVRAGAVILACWHAMIPYLVPDLPQHRRSALLRTVRAPMLYATVQVRDWRAWHAAGIDRVRFTGAYWSDVRLPALPHAGGRQAADPGEPTTVHLVRLAVKPDADPIEGAVAGRRELAEVPYEHLEFTVRDQLARLLGPAGFDPARDIQGITINRWAHGVPLGDGLPGGKPPFASPHDDPVEGEWRFGRIVIAGSDRAPEGGADAAIAIAVRAVAELQPARSR